MNSYKLVKGPDDIVWVSIQPLMNDVKQSLDKLEKIDVDGLGNVDKDIMDFNILGMKAIYTFLGALVQESILEEKRNEESTRSSVH